MNIRRDGTLFLACLLVASSAQAAVVTWTYGSGVNIPAAGVYINAETGVISGAAMSGWDVNIYGSTGMNFLSPGGYNFVRLDSQSAPPLWGPSNLVSGYSVSSIPTGGSWVTGGSVGAGVVAADGMFTPNSSNNFVGFRFVSAAGNTHYGFMQMAVGATLNTRSITAVRFESVAGAAVTVVAIPGPGALILLGQAGLLMGRRRR